MPVGLLPLSWIEEEEYYGFFPGETWRGRTWLEQNHIPAGNRRTKFLMWLAAPEKTRVRYMRKECALALPGAAQDETGYLIRPAHFSYDFSRYWNCFPGKTRKKLKKELDKFKNAEFLYHNTGLRELDWMFIQNLASFGNMSYFYDQRFLRGFDAMVSLLEKTGCLRVITVRQKGEIAAVDVGAVVDNRYTVLAGATSPEFPGVAKAINIFHIRLGMKMRFDEIDFLCGDFGWKKRFRLEQRTLYKAVAQEDAASSSVYSSVSFPEVQVAAE